VRACAGQMNDTCTRDAARTSSSQQISGQESNWPAPCAPPRPMSRTCAHLTCHTPEHARRASPPHLHERSAGSVAATVNTRRLSSEPSDSRGRLPPALQLPPWTCHASLASAKVLMAAASSHLQDPHSTAAPPGGPAATCRPGRSGPPPRRVPPSHSLTARRRRCLRRVLPSHSAESQIYLPALRRRCRAHLTRARAAISKLKCISNEGGEPTPTCSLARTHTSHQVHRSAA